MIRTRGSVILILYHVVLLLLVIGAAQGGTETEKTTPSFFIPGYVCVTLDWWPSTLCPSSVGSNKPSSSHNNDGDHKSSSRQPKMAQCPWHDAAIWKIDLNAIAPYAAQLAPFLLRVGGSLQDQYYFNEGGRPCHYDDEHDNDNKTNASQFPVDPTNRLGYGDGCIDKTKLREIAEFCHQVGCRLIWGLNGMDGRSGAKGKTNRDGPWNSSNTIAMLQYMRDIDMPLYAVTLGNEIWGEKAFLTLQQTIDAFAELQNILTRLWPYPARQPLMAGFDGDVPKGQVDFVRNVLHQMKEQEIHLDVLTYHDYPLGNGADPNVVFHALHHNPAVGQLARQYQQLAKNHTKDDDTGNRMPVWLSEGGGAFNSGSVTATATAASGFWYLDALAMTALAGHDHFCRQTLAGGNYGLLQLPLSRHETSNNEDSSDEAAPFALPDYWNALLYQRILGKIRYEFKGPVTCNEEDTAQSSHSSSPLSSQYIEQVKFYVYESKQYSDGMAILGINFNKNVSCGGHFFNHPWIWQEYKLTAAKKQQYAPWETTSLFLNGKVLQVDEDGNFPQLQGKTAAGDTLWLEPYSYGFFEFYKAMPAVSSA